LSGTGEFVASVQIPANTEPGEYILSAYFMGRTLAGMIIFVLGAGQALPPKITVIDPETNTPFSTIEQSFLFRLRGEGFAPGPVTVFVDTTSGIILGTVTAGPNGRFEENITWPFGAEIGQRTILAYEVVNGRTLEATVSVLVQRRPQ
jgi:hypothetical protein